MDERAAWPTELREWVAENDVGGRKEPPDKSRMVELYGADHLPHKVIECMSVATKDELRYWELTGLIGTNNPDGSGTPPPEDALEQLREAKGSVAGMLAATLLGGDGDGTGWQAVDQ